MRKIAISFVVAAALVFSVPFAASAADEATDPATGSYGGEQPAEPTLAGSTVVPECSSDVPWISYNVTLTDPDGQVTDTKVSLVLRSGSNSVTLPLGELVDGQLSGSKLWPGAKVDGSGNGTAWPGWEYKNGAWVETSGNYAWTRGAITATLEVNPSLTVPLSYPPASPVCVTSPPGETPSGEVAGSVSTNGEIAATGGQSAALIPLVAGGGILALVGTGLLVLRRRRLTQS